MGTDRSIGASPDRRKVWAYEGITRRSHDFSGQLVEQRGELYLFSPKQAELPMAAEVLIPAHDHYMKSEKTTARSRSTIVATYEGRSASSSCSSVCMLPDRSDS